MEHLVSYAADIVKFIKEREDEIKKKIKDNGDVKDIVRDAEILQTMLSNLTHD